MKKIIDIFKNESFWAAVGAIAAVMGVIVTVMGIIVTLWIYFDSQHKQIVVSRDFMIGRWEVNQAFVQTSGDTVSGKRVDDYFKSGRFESETRIFINDQGKKIDLAGSWELEKISDQGFNLKLKYDSGDEWKGQFKILDKNRIQNLDDNYIASRIN